MYHILNVVNIKYFIAKRKLCHETIENDHSPENILMRVLDRKPLKMFCATRSQSYKLVMRSIECLEPDLALARAHYLSTSWRD